MLRDGPATDALRASVLRMRNTTFTSNTLTLSMSKGGVSKGEGRITVDHPPTNSSQSSSLSAVTPSSAAFFAFEPDAAPRIT